MKIYKIVCCKMCPAVGEFHDINGTHTCCNMTKEMLTNPYKLSKWCPLPDYKENEQI